MLSGRLPDSIFFYLIWGLVKRLLGSHIPACLGTFAANLSASLAMFIFKHFTFFGTGIANIGAQVTDRLGKTTVSGHKLYGLQADLGAIVQGFNAFVPGFYICLFQTGSKAFFAGPGAFNARINAAIHSFW